MARFCERCARPVCSLCASEGEAHERHEGRGLPAAGERLRQRLAQLRDSLSGRQPAVEQLSAVLREQADRSVIIDV